MQLIPLGRLSLISLMLIGATTLPVYAQLNGSSEPGTDASTTVDIRPDSAAVPVIAGSVALVGVGTVTTLEESTRAAIPPDNDQTLAAPATLSSMEGKQIAQTADPSEKERLAAERKAAADQKARADAEAAAKSKSDADKRKAAEREKKEKAASDKKAKEAKAREESAAKKAAEEKAKAEGAAKSKADAEQKQADERARREQAAADRKARDLARLAETAEKIKADELAKAEAKAKAELAAAEKEAAAEAARVTAAQKKAADEERKATAAAEAKAKAEQAAAEKKAAAEAARVAAAEKKAAEEAKKAAAAAEAKAKAELAAAEKKAAEEVARVAAAEKKAADDAKKAAAAAEAKAKAEQAAAEKKAAEEAARVAAAEKKAAEEAKKAAAAAEAKAKSEARAAVAAALRNAERDLKAGKLNEAAEELAKAKAADANNAKIEPLEKRLSAAQEAKAKKDAEVSRKEAERATAAANAATALAPLSTDAPVPATIPTAVNPVAEADRLSREGRRLLADGNRDGALSSFRQAVALDSTNVEASARLRELEGGAANPDAAAGGVPPLAPAGNAPSPTGGTVASVPSANPVSVAAPAPNFSPSSSARAGEESQSAFQKGLASYQQGRLDAAVQYWNQSLSLNPGNPDAQRYLSQTRAEYEAYVRQNQNAATRVQRTARASEKLATPVTYDTAGEKSISEFLSALSLIGDISFSVAPGVDPDIRITAKLDDVPLKDALDIVLLPMGLKWNRAGDVVTVTPDLRTKFFNLTGEQVVRLRPLLERRTLQKYLYGPEGVPTMRSSELLLDESNNTLLVTDGQENINKVEAFLKDLQTVAPSGLQYKNFKIRPEEGQRIRALVEAVIKTQSDAPYDIERRVVVDRDDLIVKDTAENIGKIEQLLLDKNFLKKLETQKLGVQTFSLAPKEPIGENIEQVRELATNVVTVVKTILYAQSTESAAAAEGRRYFYDPNTLQLTITDFPDNLRAVSDYIRSLPQLSGSRRRSEIIYLKHQTASELKSLIESVLGITPAQGSSSSSDSGSTVRSIRTNQEVVFQELRIRNVRVQQGPNENEDDVTLLIRGGAQGSQEQTIKEFRSVFFEDYEITALEIRPSTTNGEGNARIEIRYAPQGDGANANNQGNNQDQNQDQEQQTQASAAEDQGITIDSVDNLNALLIRFQDSAQLQEIRGWIDALDTPVLQVSIETKLVEVNESKAKEWMPEFNILDLKKASLNGAIGNGRFANDVDQLGGIAANSRSQFDPVLSDFSSGLPSIKGSTVINAVTESINFSLRMLEQEGVVNMVNGPHVLVENGGTANFQIEKSFSDATIPGSTQGTTTGGDSNTDNNNTGNTAGSGNVLRNVDMQMTPNITQLGEIRLAIDTLDLRDVNGSIGQTFNDTNIGGGVDGNADIIDSARTRNDANSFVTRTRSLETVARVNNGGTIVIGGWNGEVAINMDAGVPVLRSLPYVGKLLFNRNHDRIEKTNLLIFLTCNIVNP